MAVIAALSALGAALWVVAPIIGVSRAPRGAGEAACPNCGPRPEADAYFCSNCGAATTVK